MNDAARPGGVNTASPDMELSGAPEQLDVVRLGRSAERPCEAELLERGLRDALDAGRVGRLAAGVRVVGEAADLDRVLRRAIAGDADQMQAERLAEAVEPPWAANGAFVTPGPGPPPSMPLVGTALAAASRAWIFWSVP